MPYFAERSGSCRGRVRIIPMKSKNLPVLLLFVMVAALGLIAYTGHAPSAIAFKALDMPAVVGLLSWLFVVALFIERSVEVIVMVLRDEPADGLQAAVDAEQARIAALQKADPAVRVDSTALDQANRALTSFRGGTKELALCVGFFLGVLVSLAGVRALASVLGPQDGHWLFSAADILVTGAVLAGGSDGVHKMANVFSNFMDALATKAKP